MIASQFQFKVCLLGQIPLSVALRMARYFALCRFAARGSLTGLTRRRSKATHLAFVELAIQVSHFFRTGDHCQLPFA